MAKERESKNLERVPSSLYRWQFNAKFTLAQATEWIPYLDALGIEGLYCSPFFVSSSDHGYDITNPHKIDPKIGTLEEYEKFSATLKAHRMEQILDIVPNHMGIKGRENLWWQDLLEEGQNSSFAHFFDVDWETEREELKGKVLLPILKDSYGKELDSQSITLVWDEGFFIKYFDYYLPLSLKSYLHLFQDHQEESSPQWRECITILKQLKEARSREERLMLKAKLVQLYKKSSLVQKNFQTQIDFLKGRRGDSSSFNALHQILEAQNYRLAFWRVAGQEINYRRFFNINELIAIHIEKRDVLEAHHKWIFELLSAQKIQGVRIDHPDGLYDPAEYFERLQHYAPPLLIIEKILDFKEPLPENWQIDGTVGYEFLNVLNGVFVKKQNAQSFYRLYEKFIGEAIDFENLLFERKKAFITLQMSSEVNSLGRRLNQLTERNRYYRDFTRRDLTRALKMIIASFSIYRTYLRAGEEISNKERSYIQRAIEKAKHKTPDIDASVFDYIKRLVLQELDHPLAEQEEVQDFVLRLQQITGPVMAKGLEDACYYIYNPLLSLNEVGGNPQYFGFSTAEFHHFNEEKLKYWPLGWLPSSTHDTKRSQDARMRLNVLSEIPQRWEEALQVWQEYNKRHKREVQKTLYPESNSEYYIYQTLFSIWPLKKLSAPDEAPLFERLWSSLLKALREAGTYTSWHQINQEYEEAAKNFVTALLSREAENPFLESFLLFQEEIARYSCWEGLSALVLNGGSCGIYELYQGNELWNFCQMDPDNRREIDYSERLTYLKEVEALRQSSDLQQHLRTLFENFQDGKIKLYILTQILHLRRQYKALFLRGDYQSLQIQRGFNEQVIAFQRLFEEHKFIFVVGRFFASHPACQESLPLGEEYWQETRLLLPEEYAGTYWRDLFSGQIFTPEKREEQLFFSLGKVFSLLPCSILVHEHLEAKA